MRLIFIWVLMAFPHLLRYQLNWKVVLRDRGLTWLGLTVVSSNVLIHCLSCEIIYGFTISNPCHKNQHVEIVAIMCGLTSQMPPITLQGNRNDGCLRRMRFKHIFFYLAFSRKKKKYRIDFLVLLWNYSYLNSVPTQIDVHY